MLEGLAPEKRERIYRQDRIIEILKWFIGSIALTLITTIVSWQLKDREIRLQELSQNHQIAQEELRLNHQINLERKATEQKYLSEFLEYALSSDINLRLRFAHYFASISLDDELQPKWEVYYKDLLEAHAVSSKTTTTSLDAASRIGGTEAISKSSPAFIPERIALKGGIDFPISDYKRMHKGYGWSEVGFHFLIRPDGSIEKGRSLERNPAFIARQNKGTIAIMLGCQSSEESLAGKDCKITEDQYQATLDLIRTLSAEFDIPPDSVFDSQEIDERKKPSHLGGLVKRIRKELKTK